MLALTLARSGTRFARRAAACASLPRRALVQTSASASSSPSSSTQASAQASTSATSIEQAQRNDDYVLRAQHARIQPLHPSLRHTPLSQHAVYPASSTLEQLSLLEVCLATGNLARARKIFDAIRSMYLDESRYAGDSAGSAVDPDDMDNFDPVQGRWQRRLRLADVLPANIHTQFLRSFFRQAVVQDSAKLAARGAKVKKRAFVSDAWQWFEMLLGDEILYGRLDDSAWAVMLKGMMATKLTNPNMQAPDPAALHLKPMSYLYDLLKTHGRSLELIMQDPIFSHAGLAGLNDYPATDVLEELAAVLAERGETDYLIEVDAVKQRLLAAQRFAQDLPSDSQSATDEDGRADHPKTAQVTEITSPQASGDTAAKLTPARRSVHENIPFKLNSLLGNLDAITGQRRVTSDPYIRQDLLEESAYDAARWQTMHDNDQLNKVGLSAETRMKSNVIQSHMSQWLDALHEHLPYTLEATPIAGGPSGQPMGGSGDEDAKELLRLMPVGKIAFITVAETLRIVSDSGIVDGVKATRAIIGVGRAIEDEFGAEAWKILQPQLYDSAMERVASARRAQVIRSFMQQEGINAGAARAARREGYGDEADELLKIEDAAERQAKLEAREKALPWTQRMRAKVGGLLIKALLDVAVVERTAVAEDGSEQVITQEQPAFWQSYQYVRGQKVGVLKLNHVIAERLDKDNLGAVSFPRYLPMLVKPKPWTNWNSGGYRIQRTPIMRTSECPEQEQYVRLAAENGQMTQVFSALDALGSTAWTINQPIFEVVSQVWNSGKAFGDIPMDNSENAIQYPKPPSEEDMRDPSMRAAYRVQIQQVNNERARMHSQRCDLNYKLEIARAYLGETFYFPHNIDFRGRAYPIPPNLAHIGDDISRGLLTFAEGRPLGARGLTWLHIQVANTAGADKVSFADREAFTKAHMEDVMDSADRPLEGRQWWLKADDPWQCLATCMELTNALRSPNPEEFVSHLPVQQDGTCNGLQHYAALGGDATGAEQVNLAVGDKPADVYTAVANLVNKELDLDIQAVDPSTATADTQVPTNVGDAEKEAQRTPTRVSDGLPPGVAGAAQTTAEARREVALALKGKVTRKVVKQTVMTTVYGVTFIGAKKQIQRQLRDRGDVPASLQYLAASYLAEKVLSCIGDLFRGASGIQLWLGLCARLIGRSVKLVEGTNLNDQFKEPMASVIWTTPLGLPVAQPYRKKKKSQIITALQSVFITDPNTPTAVDPRAQATAFPPNYIHSLDATHMMMTAIECKRRGLAYASVHDSYWTHACDVDEMAYALRDCFIKLHSQDLLGELKRGFQSRYAGYVVRRAQLVKAGRSRQQLLSKRMSGGNATEERAVTARMRDAVRETLQKGDNKNANASADAAISASASSDSTTTKPFSMQDIVKEYGAEALPPLAIANDEKMLADVLKRSRTQADSKAAQQSEEEMEADLEEQEEALFGMGEEQEQDVDATRKTTTSSPTSDIKDETTTSPALNKDGTPRKRKAKRTKEAIEADRQAKQARREARKLARQAAANGIGNTAGGTKEFAYYQLADVLPDIPPRGDFDLEIIRDSPYFFS